MRRNHLTLERVQRINERLARHVDNDSDERLGRDIRDAIVLEDEDWHVDTEGRINLVRRAEALGWFMAGNNDTDRFIDLIS